MKHSILHMLVLLVLPFSSYQNTEAQQKTATNSQPPPASTSTTSNNTAPVDVNKIIKAFSAKETEYRQALNQYSFKRDAVIQEIGMGGQVAGEYHRVSNFVFDDKGNRFEKIIFFPASTLEGLQITAEDLDDLGGVQVFALEASKIDQYKFIYIGKEKIDDLDLYVFDVAPKVMPDYKKSKERFFQGRIWVDDQDFQIVKAKGKGVPEGKQRFPIFETYREHIDGKYWFPTYTYIDDELVFPGGSVVHIRSRIRYTDFKRNKATLRIIDDPEPEETQKPEKK
jgi:hypothetical protein